MAAFHIANVVWGPRYTELYLDVSLPTQIADGNVPALAECRGSIYKLYTTREDGERIQASSAFKRLSTMIATEVHYVTVDARQSSYVAMSDCHRAAVEAAAKAEAVIVFAGPDMLYARGAFARVRELIDGGKRVIFAPCIRLSRDAFAAEFVARFSDGSVSPRELTTLALKHLHPWTTANCWPPRGSWPSNLFWPVNGEGLVTRLFHSHTMAAVANARGASFAGTHDDDFVDLAWPDEQDRYMVQDSDELCTYELSADSHMRDTLTDQVGDAETVADWAAYHAMPTHRWLFKHPIRIHGGECSPAWNDVEAASARDAAEVFDRLAREKPWAAQLKRSAVQVAKRVKLPRFVRRAGKAALTFIGRKSS